MKLSLRGQGTLLFITVLCAIGTVFVLTSTDIYRRNYNHKTKDYDQVLLNEMTTSAFSIMEAALARRLWEPPPDDSCLKSEAFSVHGELPSGMTWKVSAKYNFATKNYELLSEGRYRELKASYLKRIKVLDVSDYLLFSGSTDTLTMRRLYNPQFPAAIIARDRRIYSKGPIQFGGSIDRPNSHTNWSGSPSSWPGEFGTIIQGDRIQFAGGMHYIQYSVPKPNPWPGTNIGAMLAPFDNAFDQPETHRSQIGAGSTIITRDYGKALTLKNQVVNNAAGPLSKANVANEIYPIALFGGSPPLRSWTATDSGSYFNDPDRYSIFYYGYGGANNFGIRMDATCISRVDAFTTKKVCSHSEHWPRGFSNWRKDAGLEGTLFTSDAEEIPSPKLNWDNMEALEEDARLCGAVVKAPTPSAYQDCSTWDVEFLKKYAISGGANICEQTSPLDLDSVALNNFDPAHLTNPALKERLLRRVIYSKVPTEIRQNDPRGLKLVTLNNNTARKNFSLWIISEDTLALRGHQADQTSPLNTDPGRLREVVFNADSTASGKEPLPLVVLTPEKVHLLSPQYVPATYSYMQTYWPVVAGSIRPILHNHTDYPRQEEDGFRFGYRSYRIENMSLITNTRTGASAPFAMRGLWSGPESSARQYPSNMCMVSLAGHTLTPYPGFSLRITAQVPAYHSVANSPIPPLTSKYYGGITDRFPNSYYPAVFTVQRSAGMSGREESDLIYSGIRMHTEFDAFTPPGKRDLSQPKYVLAEGRYNMDAPISLEHKNMAWTDPFYYSDLPPGTPCLPTNLNYREAGLVSYDIGATQPSINNGRYIFIHSDPPIDYRNLGSIIGVDQPVLETRQ